jgi:hypothetical protein
MHQSKKISGRHLNQLFTSNVKISDLVEKFELALHNPTKLQRFYNGCLGLAFEGEDSKITDDIINNCIGNFSLQPRMKDRCVIGIDVNTLLNIVVFRLIQDNDDRYIMQLVHAGELRFDVSTNSINISELTELYARYNIVAGIIDSRPEIRLSKLIAYNFKNIWRCEYLTDAVKDVLDRNNKIYKTDRTSSMDNVREQLITKKIELPVDIDRVVGFRDQLKAPLRILEERAVAGERWVWREGNHADHFFHAVNYACIAKKLLLRKVS